MRFGFVNDDVDYYYYYSASEIDGNGKWGCRAGASQVIKQHVYTYNRIENDWLVWQR